MASNLYYIYYCFKNLCISCSIDFLGYIFSGIIESKMMNIKKKLTPVTSFAQGKLSVEGVPELGVEG